MEDEAGDDEHTRSGTGEWTRQKDVEVLRSCGGPWNRCQADTRMNQGWRRCRIRAQAAQTARSGPNEVSGSRTQKEGR